jgi:CRISPR/Cas system-associated exonuclease Cas4 (RecB family)
MEEKKNLYNILKTVLSYYKNLKSIEKLNWFDRLTGGDAGYLRAYKLYKNYIEIKRKRRKKKIIKFRIQKNYYYYYIKNNKKNNKKK